MPHLVIRLELPASFSHADIAGALHAANRMLDVGTVQDEISARLRGDHPDDDEREDEEDEEDEEDDDSERVILSATASIDMADHDAISDEEAERMNLADVAERLEPVAMAMYGDAIDSLDRLLADLVEFRDATHDETHATPATK
jgi:hypothetical protein